MISPFFILGFAFLLIVVSLRKNRGKYPPGPFSYPIIGNMHQLSPEPYKDYLDLQKKYGDIFSLKLGSFNAIVLNDFKSIKEVNSLREVSGRPQFPHFFDPETNVSTGIIFTEKKEWEEQRRFVLKNLRDFGFGKKSMESLVNEEIKELVESLRRDAGKVICTNGRFSVPVFNALWTIIAGERVPQAEQQFNYLIHNLMENTRDAKTFATLGYFAWFAKIFPEFSGLNAYKAKFLPIYEFMKETVASHKKTYQEDQKRDLLDCYLKEIQNTTKTDSSFYKNKGESNLLMVLYDLFLGGTDTTSVTLSWVFLQLAHHPDVQEKLYAEIKKAVGDSRWPSMTDRLQMPYVEATILEVMRVSSLVPLMLRRSVDDVEIFGYSIPKGTVVFSNLYAIHHDQKIWGDPENFRPERFLSDDGKTVKRSEYLNPFGTGKRFCIGETLARDQLFLFVSSLFQNFRVTLDSDEVNPKMDIYKGAVMRMPTEHKLIFHDRHH